MDRRTEEKLLELEIEKDMLRWREAQESAKEIVLDRGWTEDEDDFQIQVECEAKVQWSELYEQDFYRRNRRHGDFDCL